MHAGSNHQRLVALGSAGLGAFLLAGSVFAATGTVVDENGKPVIGAKVCYQLGQTQGFCGLTDARGVFDIPQSTMHGLRITADGYLPVRTKVIDDKPIVLELAGTLQIRLENVDNGEYLGGEVHLLKPSGKRIGPFPINPGGPLIIRSLAPGNYGITGKSEGFAQTRARSVDLEGGLVTVVEIPMLPRVANAPSK